MNKKLIFLGAAHSFGVVVYVTLVSFVLTNGQKWFGQKNDGILAPIAMLTLLTLSAAVVGSLIFLRPAFWALNGQKKEALWLILATLTWLFVFMVAAFLLLIAMY